MEWLINDLNTTIMLDQLNTYGVAKDEFFIPTLAANEFLHAPGGFTRHCYGKTLAPGLTRYCLKLGLRGISCGAVPILAASFPRGYGDKVASKNRNFENFGYPGGKICSYQKSIFLEKCVKSSKISSRCPYRGCCHLSTHFTSFK